jgi:TM2 domain-containing membrane protein YozV
MGDNMNTTTIQNAAHCRDCGEIISRTAPTCPHCGGRQGTGAFGAGAGPSGKDKFTAGLLALLLGGFGIHRFYLGHTGKGIIYLLFFWTFIPAILALIDGIRYLTMSNEDFEAYASR